ncbi:hypothetical protein [Paenibacillus sp. YIM B09110]|uniref:hypothetical protein n=1 Tax=Paenibacillus sp. YIM B09110 TaxID=3126102 RepID=UPI00301D3631
MSMPKIPDINPLITLTRQEVINLLLSSIAMEEISMSHIMNAEGEKLQRFLQNDQIDVKDMLKMNRSVERMMRNIIKNQMLLQFKLEDITEMEDKHWCGEDYHDE